MQEEPAVVGLNEIDPTIVQKLLRKLQVHFEVGVASQESNTLLWRKDYLRVEGAIETPTYLPDHPNESIRRRTYLRVPLAQVHETGRVTTTWLVQ